MELLVPEPLPRINPFWGKRFTICSRVDKKDYKLCQVIFPDGKFVVHVNFPYAPVTQGIAAMATIPGDGNYTHNLELHKEGKLTSHPVKYTHPEDGLAHFSQDGKVVSSIRKQSIPLADLDGHMFTALFNDVTKFRPVPGSVDHLNTTKNGGIVFVMDHDPGWVKVVGFWHKRERAARHYRRYAKSGIIGPLVGDSKGNSLAFLGPHNKGRAGDYVLVLQARTLPTFDATVGPVQTFLGGFDTEYQTNDPFQSTSVLAFRYPAVGFNELKKTMSSIDFRLETQ